MIANQAGGKPIAGHRLAGIDSEQAGRRSAEVGEYSLRSTRPVENLLRLRHKYSASFRQLNTTADPIEKDDGMTRL
ncbi:hypothetical protein D9M70_564470 [compost metagenome]